MSTDRQDPSVETAGKQNEASEAEQGPVAEDQGADESPDVEEVQEAFEITREELEKILAERDLLQEQLLRAVAEAQNIQRRAKLDKEDAIKFALDRFVKDLIPILDNFERTLDAAEKGASVEALTNGVRAIDKQLHKALQKAHVQKIEAVGQKFDPSIHEAIDVVETDDQPDDTVITQVSTGYMLHERVIRPAQVRVTKRP